MITKQELVWIVVSILFFFGLLKFDDFSTVRYASISFLFLAVIVLSLSKSINRKIFNFGGIVFLLIALNSIINFKTVDWKIFFNFSVLLVSSFLILNYVLSKSEIKNMKYSGVIIYALLLIFTIIIISTWGLRSMSLNHQYAEIYKLTSMPKQMLGVLAGWMLCYFLAYKFEYKNKCTILFFAVVIGFMIISLIGVRSFVLGFIGIIILSVINRKVQNAMVSIILISFMTLVYFTDFGVPKAILFDIRGIMLDASLNISRSFPLGLGVGGYDEYLTNIYKLNTADYKSTGLDFRYIESAVDVNVLESDLLLYMVSFGACLTSVLYYLWFKWLEYLKYSHYVTDFSNFLYFINIFYLFSGLTQDHFLSFHWWVLLLVNLYYYFKVSLREKISNSPSPRWAR